MDVSAATAEANRQILKGGGMARWLAPTVESRVETVKVADIHSRPWLPDDGQPETLEPLRRSVAARGIVEPLLLRARRVGQGYEVIAGERRLAVARTLELDAVPAIVRVMDDAAALVAVIWGVSARRRLSPPERAELEIMLVDAGLERIEAQALLGAEVSDTFAVLTTTTKPRPMLSDILAQRPPAPRLLGLMTVSTVGLPPAARQALTEVLRSIDPRPLVPPG